MSSPFQKKFSKKSPFAMHEGKPHKSIEHQASSYDFLDSDESLEGKFDRWLNFPQEKGRRKTDQQLNIVPDKDGLMREQNSFPDGDARRHYNTSRETAIAIADKIPKIVPSYIRKPISIFAALALGGGHEGNNLLNGGSLRQSLEDMTNNFPGAFASLLNDENSEKVFDTIKPVLPDGK